MIKILTMSVPCSQNFDFLQCWRGCSCAVLTLEGVVRESATLEKATDVSSIFYQCCTHPDRGCVGRGGVVPLSNFFSLYQHHSPHTG